MSRLNKAIENMFASDIGSELYQRIADTIKKENMLPYIEKGLLIGFSGGADSVFLACFLSEYKRRNTADFSKADSNVNNNQNSGYKHCNQAFTKEGTS